MTNQTGEQEMTVKEAIAAGYTHWGYDTGDYGTVSLLRDINSADFKDCRYPLVLMGKEEHHPTYDISDLPERLSEEIDDNMGIGDDTAQVLDAIKEAVNWEDIGDKINAALAKITYYYSTEIRLKP